MNKMNKMLFHKNPTQIISKFGKSARGVLNKPKSPYNNIPAILSYRGKRFEVNFNYDISGDRVDVGQFDKKVLFTQKDKSIVFEDLYIDQHNNFSKIKASVSSFYTKGYLKTKKYYYRLIIPIHINFNFHYQIEEIAINSDFGYLTRCGTKATINNVELIAYVIHNEKNTNQYFVVESETLQNYQEFSEKAFALKNAIGYLTGHLHGDNGYFFVYTNKKMEIPKHYYFCTFRNTIHSFYTPINNNPFAYLNSNRKLVQSYYDKKILKVITITQLSNLSQKLHDSLEFSFAILLLLESSIASLLFMPGGYAIVLETLSDIIIGNDKLKLAPIKDKSISKLVRDECSKVIKEYCSTIDPDDLKALLNRINQINQVTNKERLRAPFKKLGIELLKEDLELLETRNDFLHGRVPDITKKGENRTTDRKNRDLYYASMRFYTLLNMLILKWIGFDNYVINHPKIQESFCKINLKEKPYRKV